LSAVQPHQVPVVADLSAVPVRRLGPADLSDIVAVTGDRGWSAQLAKWQLMLAVGEAYGVPDPAGRGLAGIVVLTRYGTQLAAIGMMVVASRYGRLGLGTRLMEYVLGLAGDAVVYLTATEYGEGLYRRLGFRELDNSVTYLGQLHPQVAAGAGRGRLRPVRPADLPAIAGYDRQVFGADRTSVLTELLGFSTRYLMTEDGRGFGACWLDGDLLTVGPVAADDVRVATMLIGALAAGWNGRIRLDILGRHSELADWATASGLRAGHRTLLMARGGKLPGDRSRLFSPTTVGIG